jgi:periplasmic protein TonB
MNNFATHQLEEAVSTLIAGKPFHPYPGDPQVQPLLAIAAELLYLPRPEFRARLHADLLQRTSHAPFDTTLNVRPATQPPVVSKPRTPRESVVPPLFSPGSVAFPMRGSHLAISFALHVAALALVVASGWWMVENRAAVRSTVAGLIPTDIYLLPPGRSQSHGGGGGGDQDKMNASRGSAPRFSSEQLTPPAVIVRNEDPKLPAEPTVIGPPDIVLPQTPQAGDPMSQILAPPSNGTGSGGGIGSGEGGGVGPGRGPGVGEGIGGGIGGGIFHVGGGVSAPRPIYDPDPEYSEEARRAKYQGNVMLWAVIGPDGRPRDLRIARSLGMGLDQKAIDAVAKWRFAPAMKDGQPVAVQVNIEVSFRLY